MNRIRSKAALLLTVLLTPISGFAAQGDEILKQQCSQCHSLTGAKIETVEDLWAMKGPDLSFAGYKYKQPWLETWLAKPARIRPAGMFYGNHLKEGQERDEIDASTLKDHSALSAADAKQVAATLMGYKAKSELMEAGAYKEGSIALRMGEMLFDKFRGCLACHRIEPEYGGLSGPEVYTVAERLQEDFLVSYMRQPHAWTPKTFKPASKLKEKDVQKFVHYFKALAKEDFQ